MNQNVLNLLGQHLPHHTSPCLIATYIETDDILTDVVILIRSG